MKTRTPLWLAAGYLILAAILLAGCESGKEVIDGLTHGPEDIASQWFEALNNEDITALYDLVHPQREAELESTLINPLSGIRSGFLMDVRYTQIDFLAVTSEGEMAVVQVSAKKINGKLGTNDTFSESITLRKFEGKWKIWSVGEQF